MPDKTAETLAFTTHSPEDTIALGRRLAVELRPPMLVLLEGDLGAGKTTLTKGLVSGLGAATEEEVTSPTFTLIHEYGVRPRAGARSGKALRDIPGGSGGGTGSQPTRAEPPRVYHVDLYRIETARELDTLALDDLLAENAVVIIEWGEKLGEALREALPPGRRLEIRITAPGDAERRIELRTV